MRSVNRTKRLSEHWLQPVTLAVRLTELWLQLVTPEPFRGYNWFGYEGGWLTEFWFQPVLEKHQVNRISVTCGYGDGSVNLNRLRPVTPNFRLTDLG